MLHCSFAPCRVAWCREDRMDSILAKQQSGMARRGQCDIQPQYLQSLPHVQSPISSSPTPLACHGFSVSCLCSISSGVSEVPRHVVPPLARLCYSVLMWAWQLGSGGGVATTRCCLVTKQLLKQSPSLLVSVLELFASETEGMFITKRPRKTIVWHQKIILAVSWNRNIVNSQ